jgi:predicted secreted hydrolase
MNIGNFQISKKSAPFSRVKGMLLFSIILLMITPSIPVYAEGIADHEHPEMSWKDYPYQPPGTDIVFPKDEGSHDKEYAIEWWYANFHLTGQSGNEYGAFVAFYQIQSTVAEKQEVRIFSISDVESEKTYTNAQIGTLVASNDHLDLSFEYFTSSSENINQKVSATDNTKLISANQGTAMKTQYTETSMKPINKNIIMDTTRTVSIQKTNTIVTINGDDKESANELQYDHWYTKSDDQGLLPFQYSLIVNGNSQQDQQLMKLVVDMDCLKRPLIVGSDGFLDLGEYGFSFYYGLTKLAVTGSIIVHGIVEEVTGFAWIDHQWGDFFDKNQPPYGLALTYEWFSVQLDNNREIMVADTWDRVTGEKNDQSFTGGMNLINSDGSSELLEGYTITPQATWNDALDHRFYSSCWRITETSKSIDLIVTPIFLDQVMRVKENYPLLQRLLEDMFPGACFWEGICSVSGTINGVSVNGKSYVELTHCCDYGDNTDLIPSEQRSTIT